MSFAGPVGGWVAKKVAKKVIGAAVKRAATSAATNYFRSRVGGFGQGQQDGGTVVQKKEKPKFRGVDLTTLPRA